MEAIKINDLFAYKFLSEVSYSPDGKYATFTVSNCDDKDNNYKSYLWVLNTTDNSVKKLTANADERSHIWLDDKSLLFASKRGKSEAAKTTYFKINVEGGEAEAAFTIPAKVAALKKLSDDSYLVIASKPCEEPAPEDKLKAKEGTDFLIFDEIPFWANGQGIRNKIRNVAMLFTPSTGKLEQLTDKYFNIQGFKASEDGTKVLLWGPTYTDMMPTFSGVYEYHIGSRSIHTIVKPDELAITFAAYWMGKILVEGSQKIRSSSQNPELYLVDPATKERTLFADLDAGLGSSSGSDIGYGGGTTMKVVGDSIYCLHTQMGNAYLSRLDKDGKLSHINEVVGSINCFDIHAGKAIMVALRNYELQELYTVCLESGKETCITSFNKEFTDTHSVVKPEYFTFTAKAGHLLEGWVIKPANYTPGTKYPGILTMHGGPKVVFGTNYHHEMQCMANMGMFVFYTNPRGSDGRGEDFSDLVGKLGETDYEDFMEFTDEVIKRYPDLNENKIGICGGSYGGFMCNWMIGHTNRFAAAASQRSISNYFSKCLTTDIGYYHNLSQMASSPWVNSEKMWYHSPLKYVANATTPTLFIQSDEDYRCWMSEPLQMFTNLRERNIPSKVVLFHGENHELSRSGKPKNRIKRLTEICNWFDTYLR